MKKQDKLATLIPMEQLEQEAQKQIWDALRLPFLKKLAIMPDCHAGYSLPIGGVALLHKVVSPGYVGYDIGCGMCSIVTGVDIPNWSLEEKLDIQKAIMDVIPVGFSGHDSSIGYSEFKSRSENKELNKKVNEKLGEQLGTLGGGNHFIEIGSNNQGKLAITIHSGSRNPGHSVGGFYMKLSRNEDKKLPNGFLDQDGDLGKAYLADMNFMLEYALANRSMMMIKTLQILGLGKISDYNMINENHNHAMVMGEDVLHRKGATPADKGQLGVIPGNMRDGVYITEGLGNEIYLSSASHGAGRLMSRSKARETIDLEVFKDQMKDVVGVVESHTLDEAPDAYKDINQVIALQEGIVMTVMDFIKPVINIKG